MVIAALAPVVAMAAVQAWRKNAGTKTGRTLLSLSALSTVLFVALLWHWNLIGFNY